MKAIMKRCTLRAIFLLGVIAFLTIPVKQLNACCGYDITPTTTIQLTQPQSLAFNPNTNCLAVADSTTGTVTTYALLNDCTYSSTPSTTIQFSKPFTVAFNPNTNCLAVTDVITGTVTTYALVSGCTYSTTPSTTIQLSKPSSIAFNPNTNCLAVSDSNNLNVTIYPQISDCLYSTTPSTIIPALNNPIGVAFNPSNNCLAISQILNINIYPLIGDCVYSTAPSTTFGTLAPLVLAFNPNNSCILFTSILLLEGGSAIFVCPQISDCVYSTTPSYTTEVMESIVAGAFSPLSNCLAFTEGPNVNILEPLSECAYSNTPATVIPLTQPIALAFNPNTNCLAVGDGTTGKVTIYAPTGVVANPQSFVTCANTPYSGTLTATSSGSTITSYAVTQPFNGSIVVNVATGAFTYTPIAGYSGPDSFTFTATNSAGCTSLSAIVTITVDSVIANPQSINACANAIYSGLLTASSNGTITGYTRFALPAHGMLSVPTSNGVFTYTPATGYLGDDSFTFTATDSIGCTSAPATVTITVANCGGACCGF